MKSSKKVNRQIQAKKGNSERMLKGYAFTIPSDLFGIFNATPQGLFSVQVEERQEKYGKNIITNGQKNSPLHRLRESVINPFNIVLLVIAAVSLFTDVIVSTEADYLTVIIILAMVFLSSLVAFVQSQRSNSAAMQLSQMISNKADTLRDGTFSEISIVAGSDSHAESVMRFFSNGNSVRQCRCGIYKTAAKMGDRINQEFYGVHGTAQLDI
jgi:Mg2+-importing ATPase